MKTKIDVLYEELQNSVEHGYLTELEADIYFTEACAVLCLGDNDNYVSEDAEYDRANTNGLVKPNKFKEAIREGKEKVKDSASIFKQMHEKIQRQCAKETHTVRLNEDEFDKLVEAEKKARAELEYNKYKKYFEEIRRICGLKDGSINIRFINKKKVGNEFEVEVIYSRSPKKIHIPDGYALYHYSNIHDLKKLYPSFKGKRMGEDRMPHMNGTGELYSAPRIYLLIRPMESRITGYDKKKTDVKRQAYVLAENVRDVYVDPNSGPAKFAIGAVYVETLFPIRVKKFEG